MCARQASFSVIFVLNKITASIFQIIQIWNKTLDPSVLDKSIRSQFVLSIFLLFENVKEIMWQNDAWKGYLKTWDRWNSQSFQGLCPWSLQERLTVPTSAQSCKGQCSDTRWVMAYDHKTQSFMKNSGQQKCLDKALNGDNILLPEFQE